MSNFIQDGDQIDPKNLELLIKEKLNVILLKVKNYLPLGLNILYNLLNVKTFIQRPKALTNSYDTRSLNSVGLPIINSPYLGSPWTLELGNALNLNTSQTQLVNNTDSFYRTRDKLTVNPASDYVYGSLPFKGNSPFIFNGYLGFSNFCEDENIRIVVSENGQSLNIKAAKVSTYIRATSGQFNFTGDNLATTDRTNLEDFPLSNIDLTVAYSGVFSTSVSGFSTGSPNIPSDYYVWLVYDSVNGRPLILLVPQQTYAKVAGEVYEPYSGFYAAYPNFRYIRLIGCVYVSGTSISDARFKSSNTAAWEETTTGINVNPLYGKLYQQDQQSDTSIQLSTQSDDRRSVPGYYYFNQKNSDSLQLVGYKGIIKNTPGAGGNRVIVKKSGLSGSERLSITAGSLEVSDGTSSLFLSGLSISNLALSATTQDAGYSGSSGAYIWIFVNPYSILDTTTSTVSRPQTNLRVKVVVSSVATYAAFNAGTKAALEAANYTFRSRIAWIPITPSNQFINEVICKDGYHYIRTAGSYWSTGSSLPGPSLVLDSDTTSSLYKQTNCLGKLPTAGNSGIPICNWVEGKLYYSSYLSTGNSAINFVGLTSSGGVTTGTVTYTTPTNCLYMERTSFGAVKSKVGGQQYFKQAIMSGSSLYYVSNSPTNGSSGTHQGGVIIDGWYLAPGYY